MPVTPVSHELIGDNPRIILFDGICRLCSGWIGFVYKRDPAGRFRFAAVQSRAGQALLEACGLPTDRFDTMVYIESGRAYYRSDAFLRIVRHLPMCWPLLAVAGICPRFIRDRVYDLIARDRSAVVTDVAGAASF